MEEVIIKPHSFEMAKKNLKEFSQKKSKDFDIEEVDTDGFFLGFGNHKVTGTELNERMGTVQNNMIAMNENINKTIKEFSEIYNALEALDKEYIQAILISVKNTEMTSEKIKKNQQDLKGVVENQKKSVKILKAFKEKIDQNRHLKDVDLMWENVQNWQEDMVDLSAMIEEAENNITNLSTNVEDIKKNVRTLKEFKKETEEKTQLLEMKIGKLDSQIIKLHEFSQKIKKIGHLYDVDALWNDSMGMKKSLKIQDSKIESVKQKNDLMQETMQKIKKIEHLYDVDALWNDSMDIKNSLMTQDSKIENVEKKNDMMLKMMQKIEMVENENVNTVATIKKKIRYAYIVAGGAIGIAAAEFVLILIGVI